MVPPPTGASSRKSKAVGLVDEAIDEVRLEASEREEPLEQIGLFAKDVELSHIALDIEKVWGEMLGNVIEFELLPGRNTFPLVDETRNAIELGLADRALRLKKLAADARRKGAPKPPGVDEPPMRALPLLERTRKLGGRWKVGPRRGGSPHMVVWDAITLVVNFAFASSRPGDPDLICVVPSDQQEDDPRSPRFRAGAVFCGDRIRKWILQHAVRRGTGSTLEGVEAYAQLVWLKDSFDDFALRDIAVAKLVRERARARGKTSLSSLHRTTISKWASGEPAPTGWTLGRPFFDFLLERRNKRFSKRRVEVLADLLSRSRQQLEHFRAAVQRLGWGPAVRTFVNP